MKILVVGQHFYPEQFRINDICFSLAKRGHEVTMLTGLPNYPEGKIYPGYQHGENRDEGRIYGIVPENYNFAWETHLDEDGVEREYACVDVFGA